MIGLLASTSFRTREKLSKPSSTNEVLNLLLQLEAVFNIMVVISMIPAILYAIPPTGI